MTSRSNLLTSFVIVIIVFAGVGSALFITTQYEPPRICVVFTAPGEGDLGLGDQAYIGLNQLRGDIVVSVESILVERDDLLTQEGRQAAIDQIVSQSRTRGYEIVVGVGKDLKAIIEGAANEMPNQPFALIGGESNIGNVASATFTSEEAAFLAGFIGALVASPLNTATGRNNQTGNIAILGSFVDDETVASLVHGFKQGVQYANDTYLVNAAYKVHIVNETYLNGYNKTTEAENIAYRWYANESVGLIFAAVRASIKGIRNAMVHANVSLMNPNVTAHTRMPLAIATEANLDYYGNPDINVLSGPSWIVTSVVFRADLAIYDIVNKTLWGNYLGSENLIYDVYNGGCNITNMEFSTVYVYPIDMQWLKTTNRQLLNGTLPYTITRLP